MEVVQACDPRMGFRHKGDNIYEPVDLADCQRAKLIIVELNGRVVPMPVWSATVVSVGDHILVRRVPGISGGGGKSILRIFAILTVLVVAAYLAPVIGAGLAAVGITSATATSLAFSIVAGIGTFLVNALLPPPLPKLPAQGTTQGRDPLVHSITGIGNNANPYGVIPRVYGRRKVFPVFPGKSPTQYTEIAGDDQYLMALFLVGKGPLEISELKLGDTLIDEFQDVQYEINGGWDAAFQHSLYTKDVHEENVSVPLVNADGWTLRTTNPGVDEISVDIAWPQGLFVLSDTGEREAWGAYVKIQYRRTQTGPWVTVRPATINSPNVNTEFPTHFYVNRQSTALVRINARWKVPRGQYDVRCWKSNPDTDDPRTIETTVWSVVRGITNQPPVKTDEGVATIAIRIRATDQLNGFISNLNCIAESFLWRHEGGQYGGWAGPVKTGNPAWVYADILAGNSNKRAIPRRMMDGYALEQWAARCDEAGRKCNYVFDRGTSVKTATRLACAVGRAVPNVVDGKYTVAEDLEQDVPIFQFTEENIWGYRGKRSFVDVPHGLKVQFVNEREDFQQDERIVYRDGYSATNARKFESLSYEGITDPDAVWSRARYDQAIALLRPEVHIFNTDREHLRITLGDMGLLAHDVMLVGLRSSRVTEVITNTSGEATAIRIGVAVVFESDQSYSVKIRATENGVIDTRSLLTTPGETNLLQFERPIESSEQQPEDGDIVTFGISGRETIQVIAKSIRPYWEGGGLCAEVTCVNYNQAIYHADQMALPPWDSGISLRPPLLREIPVIPVFGAIRSDESVLQRSVDGSLVSAMVVALSLPGGTEVREDWNFEIRYRIRLPNNDGHWFGTGLVRVSESEIVILNVEDGLEYELEARISNGFGLVSRYTDPHYHRVVGKSSPPRDVDTFLVDQQGDGGRIFSWNYPDPPPDLAGFRIRYRQQTVQSSIIRYEYRLRRTDTQTWSAWIPIPGSAPGNEHDSSFTVQPLVEQQEYAFQLRSRTLTGPSEPTATFTATTLFGEVIVELPVADAPTVTIQAVASGIEATTVTLMATVGDGGTYDGSVEYAWRVSGGTLNEATAAAPVWTRPAVTGDTPYTIDLTITVRGTGTVADDGTSDTAVAPQVTTVVSATGTLPTAAAPAVAIDPVSSGNEGTSVTLGATVTGGTYDALTYAWTVSSGTLDDATAAAPTWRRPLVNADSNVSISLTVSATGTGTVARANTSDTAMATDVTTLVSNVAAQGSVGDRITSEEWTLPSDNGVGSGIAVDGTYAYVVDLVDEKVYVYQLSDGVRQTSREFNLATANTGPTGIAVDSTYAYVVDNGENKVYVYQLSDGAQQTSREFTLANFNSNARGIWVDTTHAYVVDGTRTIYVYQLSDGAEQSSRNITLLLQNSQPEGIGVDGTYAYVVDSNAQKVFVYQLSDGERQQANEWSLASVNTNPLGMTVHNMKAYVVDWNDLHVYIYRASL